MDAIIQSSQSKLTDSNFHLWKLRTESNLKARDAWIAISQERPQDANAQATWDKANNLAMGYMTNAMEDSVLGQFINVGTARELWQKLKDKYEANTKIQKIALRNEIAALKMRSEENWKTYLLRATNLGERAKALGMDVDDSEIAYNIVRGLPAKYQALKTSFSTQPIIDLDLLKRALSEDEEQNSERWEKDSAYKTKASNGQRTQGNNKFKEICWYCNKPGHKRSKCWKLHGKPDNKGTQSRRTPETGNKSRQTNNSVQAKFAEESLEVNENLWSVNESNKRQDESTGWMLDSGATSHMCAKREWLSKFVPQSRTVKFANDATAGIAGKGEVKLLSHETGNVIRVSDVLYVPSLRGNLISVSKIVKNSNGTVIFDSSEAKVISQNGNVIAIAKAVDNFYYFNVDTLTENANHASENACDEQTNISISKGLWHRRLNHLNEAYMNKLKDNEMVKGLNFEEGRIEFCHPCNAAKLTKSPYKSIGQKQSSGPLDLLHMDICGPFPKESIEGDRYMLTIVDDFSRKYFAFCLKTKDEAAATIEYFINREENILGRNVKSIRTDNGGEFMGKNLQKFFNQKGIKHQLTTAYSPQSNGIAERANRTIVETVRTLLIDSKLPYEFWCEAARCAAYVKNACPTKVNDLQTPYQKYHGKLPTANHLRVFGSLVYYHVPKERRKSKLAPTGKEAIFTGYSEKRLAYRVFDPNDKCIHEVKHVKFHEDKNGSTLLSQCDSKENIRDLTYEIVQMPPVTAPILQEDRPPTPERENVRQRDQDDNGVHNDRNDEFQLRRSERIRNQQQNRGMPNYRVDNSTDSEVETDTEDVLLINEESKLCQTDEITPNSYSEAMSSPYREQWMKAMQSEVNSLKAHGVWKIIRRGNDAKTIKSKWVYKIKRNADGSVERFKARLVGLGCGQRPGQDYNIDKTFSPVVKHESLRTLLAIAKMRNFDMKVYDISTAYLHGELHDDILMEQPEGFEDEDPAIFVCQLQKGIYGLKQSGRIWYETLRSYLIDNGFKQLEFDPCIFHLKTENGEIFLAVYVDDLIAVGTNSDIIEEGITLIRQRFNVNDVTESGKILGWNFEWSADELKLTQETYIKELLQKFSMTECKPTKSPSVPGDNLNDYENSEKIDKKVYQEIIGSLMYLVTGTRPDLAYAVTTLAKYLQDPRAIHLRTAKRILRYLKGTTDRGLVYTAENGKLKGYADASWNDGNKDEKSVTGYVIQVGSSTIHWKTQNQQNVSLSTCQSEITAISACIKEMIWIRGLIAELSGGQFLQAPVHVYNDNQAAIAATENIASYSKIRHFVRITTFIRQQVELGNYKVVFVPGNKLCADMFTKPMTGPMLSALIETINMK